MTSQQAARAAQAALSFHIDRMSIRVQRLAERILERPVVMRQSKENGARLLRLLQWEQELQVPLSYILRVLLLHWKDAGHVSRRLTYEHKGLGIAVTTLTGTYSRKLVEQAILQDYPNGEHFNIVRDRIELYALTRYRRIQDQTVPFTDTSEFIKEYSKRLTLQRKALDSIQDVLSRRAWRGNPFRG